MSFFKNLFSKKSVEELKNQSRLDYDKALKNVGDRSTLGVRLRLANRAKVNIEKTFLEAASLTDKYESLKEAYLANDESIEGLEVPKLVDPYQLISTDKGVVVSFIPEEYADEVFKLGCSYQTCVITAEKAAEVAQSILDKICFELGINKEIDVLEFLTSEENQPTDVD